MENKNLLTSIINASKINSEIIGDTVYLKGLDKDSVIIRVEFGYSAGEHKVCDKLVLTAISKSCGQIDRCEVTFDSLFGPAGWKRSIKYFDEQKISDLGKTIKQYMSIYGVYNFIKDKKAGL